MMSFSKNTRKTLFPIALLAASPFSSASAQSLYEADWSTLTGTVNSSYSVTMKLTSGPAIQSISAYNIDITGNVGQWSVAPTGPFAPVVASGPSGPLSFTVSGAPSASLFTNTDLYFYNPNATFTSLQDPTGTPTNPGNWPFILGPGNAGTPPPAGTFVNTEYTSQSFGFTAIEGSIVKGNFVPQSTAGFDEFVIDITQTYNAIPEPSSTALFGLGTLGFLLRRKR